MFLIDCILESFKIVLPNKFSRGDRHNDLFITPTFSRFKEHEYLAVHYSQYSDIWIRLISYVRNDIYNSSAEVGAVNDGVKFKQR